MKEKINLKNVLDVYENEIKKHVKNKKRLLSFEKNKMRSIAEIMDRMKNPDYKIRKYNIFLVREPKVRVVMSLDMDDKIINHFVTRYALMPKLEKYLDDRNIATRKGMGTEYGIKLFKKHLEKNKKYDKFYILKIDISKYFYNIDHEVLKSMLIDKLDDFEYRIISNIIDSSNEPYINERINKLRASDNTLPLYYHGKGLPIGNMTSQFLSIFYLNSLDHYIVHDLHLKYYIRYMDDFVIIHHDLDYLKKCLELITDKLENVFKLKVNTKKTKIVNMKEGVGFLGYRFRVLENKTITVVKKEAYERMKKRVKEVNYEYDNGLIGMEQYFSCISNYRNSFKHGSVKKIRRYITKNM